MTATRRIEPGRVQPLNRDLPRDGKYVLYWMQQSQRANFNHALEFAATQANQRNEPLIVGFGLMDDYPDANARHYAFMLQGLSETRLSLLKRGIRMVVLHQPPAEAALELATEASLVVCDRGYTRHQKQWRRHVAAKARRLVIQVEADVVVPVEIASTSSQAGARTIRPRIAAHLDEYLVGLRSTALRRDSLGWAEGIDVSDADVVLRQLRIDRSVPPVSLFAGGTGAGRRVLRSFIDTLLDGYAANRNQPQTDNVSHMSKYLHFGQISPVEVALAVRDSDKGSPQDRDSFLEELIVRRELAQNYCNFVAGYDKFTSLPAWARATLRRHGRDKRPFRYTRNELENAQTHDPYWNAAMREMRYTGYMHNYMRMYWGKKIIEWSATPQQAYATVLAINNKYFIDGRDPNSFANIAWLFGQHDRPWPERPVFGKVRYMNAAGLEKKADPQAYVQKVERLVRQLA